ncbi:MAG: response regulator [Ignavibacteriae bacterium]|nr:response regulator [Ignavibacteriota bacterium]
MKKAEILIVEDDILTANVIQKYLTKNGYDVNAIAPNATETFKELEKAKPDLILMDIFLRNSIDGIEIAKQVKVKYDIPIIYLTADSSEATIARAKITEPFGYLVKPVDSKILITNVELTIQKQLSHNNKILEALRIKNDELEQKVKERTSELMTMNQELKNEIRQRKLAEDALKKAERLATIGKMSAVLAHEIRNPLNSIKINADILIETLELTENKKRRLQIMQKEVNRLDNLVKEVLLYSRHVNLVFTEFNLFNLIDNLILQLKPHFEEKKIILRNNLDKINIKGDSEKLKQVFINLILNAVDAVPEDGTIEFSCESIDGKTNIFVKDNGCGILDAEKVFEPFYTTKNLGTGLGLPISQNIVEQHSGTMKVLNSKEGETVFCITIPTQ